MRALSGMDRLWRRWHRRRYGRRQLSQMGLPHGGDHNRSVAADKTVLAPLHDLPPAHDWPPPRFFFSDSSEAKGCSPASATLGGANWAPALRGSVSYTHLRAHETRHDLVCRLLLEKKKKI